MLWALLFLVTSNEGARLLRRSCRDPILQNLKIDIVTAVDIVNFVVEIPDKLVHIIPLFLYKYFDIRLGDLEHLSISIPEVILLFFFHQTVHGSVE